MQTGNTARQTPRSVPQEKEKLNILRVKSTFLRIISHSTKVQLKMDRGPEKSFLQRGPKDGQ